MFNNNSTIFCLSLILILLCLSIVFVYVFLYVGGYYTLITRTGIRVIALNTNMYYKDPLTEHLEDPADQLAWLDDQLTAAASNNEKVSSGSLCGVDRVESQESSLRGCYHG